MAKERNTLMEPIIREVLDSITIDPCDDHITPLFNYISFKSECVTTISSVITRSDYDCIYPSVVIPNRTPGTLKSKIVELKSRHTIFLTPFNNSVQSDPDTFVKFAQC